MRSKFIVLAVSGCAAVLVTAAMAQVLSPPADPRADPKSRPPELVPPIADSTNRTSPPPPVPSTTRMPSPAIADPTAGAGLPPAKAEENFAGSITVVGSAAPETPVAPASNYPPGSLPRAPAGGVWRTHAVPVLEYQALPPGAGVGNVAVFQDFSGRQAVNELAEKLAKTEDKAEREKIQQSLRAALKEQFEARLKTNEKEIEQLEAEVKRLRGQLELRRKRQNEIVDFRLTQLLREAQGLGWGTEPQRPGAVLRAVPNPGYPGNDPFETKPLQPDMLPVRP